MFLLGQIWDLREGRLLFTIHGHKGAINHGAWSPDGQFFATGGADQLVMVWQSKLPGHGEEGESSGGEKREGC